jgi:hypothetical protein
MVSVCSFVFCFLFHLLQIHALPTVVKLIYLSLVFACRSFDSFILETNFFSVFDAKIVIPNISTDISCEVENFFFII